MLFSNILIYFVLIPILMLGGVALCRNIKQIRAVAVIGSTALIALSAYLIAEFLKAPAEAAVDGMYYYQSWHWFTAQNLNINLTVGVDGVSIAMLLLSSIILFTGSFASWTINQPKAFFLWLILLST
ncbi:MAG: NADH-quinone oxidoreductase subunit M, partial [Muribaculaceae bacterium]|nr:NADH-quinone oxidoreductase subunit M [Muribaculaceae bacterium]